MALNKLESQIKEQLNSREIQPSAQAWDRLDAMLTVAEEKKTKRSFGWLYIAASITVLLTAGMFFFSQEGTGINTENAVVGTETVKDPVQNENKSKTPIATENQVADSNPNINHQNPINNNQVNQFQSSPDAQPNSLGRSGKNQKTNQNQSNNPLINRGKDIEYQNSSDVALKDLPKIVEPQREIIANRPSKNAMSDEELLASLDKVGKSADKKAALKVDAKNLLTQVDGELEMTFREKVINKVAKNYKEVKVALANRNKE